MKWRTIVVLLFFLGSSAFADTKGLRIGTVTTSRGESISLYDNSYALLIAVSNYRMGWPKLTSVPQEMAEVEAVLKATGFSVTTVVDPDDVQLEQAFKTFIRNYGYDTNNRLLFFYSGHGWSRKQGEQGYLVPVNAPDPTKNEKEFLKKTVTMTQILAWCKEIEARHALFLFDSCFSGTIFKTKALPDHPAHISPLIAKPVRQFITAGDAGEKVPAKSVFAPSLIRALRGEADYTKDGYVTGTELGLYLRDKVLYYQTGQTPQYGKIRDPNLDEGDFVFWVRPQFPPERDPLPVPPPAPKQAQPPPSPPAPISAPPEERTDLTASWLRAMQKKTNPATPAPPPPDKQSPKTNLSEKENASEKDSVTRMWFRVVNEHQNK